VRVLPSERLISGDSEGVPLPDSHSELPPVIRRTAKRLRFGCAARDNWMLRRPRMRSPDCG